MALQMKDGLPADRGKLCLFNRIQSALPGPQIREIITAGANTMSKLCGAGMIAASAPERETSSALAYTIVAARLHNRGSHHGATAQFNGFMGLESRVPRHARPSGIAAARSCTLTADGDSAAAAPTSLQRTLRVRSSHPVAVAG